MIENPVNIAVAMACYNRRDKTLLCLEKLKSNIGTFDLKVYLVDDGSTDGTGEAVKQSFPAVTLLKGTGDLFWGGGMRAAMTSAMETNFDFILWLNDDVELSSISIQTLLDAYHVARDQCGSELTIIVGATQFPGKSEITYSGFRRTSTLNPTKLEKIIPDSTKIIDCDTLNGNIVLIPRAVVTKIGTIDPRLPHQLGDIDYGYRLKNAGGFIYLAPKIVGFCKSNPPRKYPKTFEQWLISIKSPLGLPVQAWSIFMFRHAPVASLILLPGIYLKWTLRSLLQAIK